MKTIILHGWGHRGELWKQLAQSLGNDARAIDLPGFGSEPLVDENWGIPEYTRWVIRKIKREKNVVLIGHSFGGRIAAEIASSNPKYLKAVILSGAPCLYRPSQSVKFKIKLYKLLKPLMPQNIRKLFYSDDLKKAGKLEKVFRKVVTYDQTKQLKKIKAPTLLIWGKYDDQVPLGVAREMRRLISNSQLKTVEDTGHNVYLQNPNLFYGYVKKFISNL